MSSPDAQAAVATQVVNSINNNSTVAKAIDVKMSNALTNPVSASYQATNSLVNTSVVNSLQQPEVKAQLNAQTQNYLQSNAGSTIIASGVSNAISNNAQTQLAIDTYVATQMATTSSIGESVSGAVMKAVNTPAVQNSLVESIKAVCVTKEEFEDYKVEMEYNPSNPPAVMSLLPETENIVQELTNEAIGLGNEIEMAVNNANNASL
jgi:hypothetical protein